MICSKIYLCKRILKNHEENILESNPYGKNSDWEVIFQEVTEFQLALMLLHRKNVKLLYWSNDWENATPIPVVPFIFFSKIVSHISVPFEQQDREDRRRRGTRSKRRTEVSGGSTARDRGSGSDSSWEQKPRSHPTCSDLINISALSLFV